ncbi:MAG: hypothetical protein HYZ36_01900 [Pedosphaera parvula]|nr:hypothetical protein [Pedosphaera parvula]
MPITINLLAEERAAEELRRRDPVKRAAWAAGALVGFVVVFIIVTQVRVSATKGVLAKKEAEWGELEKPSKVVENDFKKISALEGKIDSLNQLATNRFLWAVPLDTLQRCVVDNIQVLRISTEQAYIVTRPEKPARGAKEKVKPPTSTEKLTITIQAKDTGKPNDQNYAKFIETIANHAYFKEALAKRGGITMLDRGEPQPDLSDPTKTFSLFTIRLLYPETVR